MAQRKAGKGGRPQKRTPQRYGAGPFRRRRSRYSRQSQRNGVLFLVVALFLGVAGIAIANAFSGQKGTSLSGADVSEQPTSVATSASPSPTPKPTRATPTATRTPEAPTASPTPVTTPREHHTAEPVESPRSTSKPSPSASAGCPAASTRLARARALLQHPSNVPQVSVVTAGSRSGTLGIADLAARTITLYLRSCAEESTTQLAVVWMYEAGQFVDVESWDAATQDRWRQLRGGASFGSTEALRQDAASVYAYWQTGTTQSWQSPVAPPSASQLSELATYLHMR